MAKFSIYYNPDDLTELSSMTPYNLKKDLKGMKKDELDRIAEEIVNVIHDGIERPPKTSALYWGKNRKVTYAKIRVSDEVRGIGNSGGYRCIVLVDYVNNAAFLLHLYQHSKNGDGDIPKSEKNQLKKLVDTYLESLQMQ